MCYLASHGHMGYRLVAVFPDKEAHLQLVVWKCYSTCQYLLIDHIHLVLKICCMCVYGGLPPVNLVILGTDWCWCTNTDKELHLSFYLWS